MSPPDRADWRPTATLETLRRRAEILARIRAFFAERGVVEVETPVLASAPASDLHLEAPRAALEIPASGAHPGGERTFYLQTSPEYAMKRLLAAGAGAIYQLGKAFRDGEVSRRHNPEFTILEWYRPGFDHHALMDEVAELVAGVLTAPPRPAPRIEKTTYAEAFRRHAGVDDVHRASVAELASRAREAGLDVVGLGEEDDDLDDWRYLLGSHLVEPKLGRGPEGREAGERAITLLYDYPASQAALARVRPADGANPAVAERFEVYVDGVELANGFHELADAAEQRRRFQADLEERRTRGRDVPPIDERLLAALEAGIGDCAGVALGVDRLVMLALGASRIEEVLAFPIDRA